MTASGAQSSGSSSTPQDRAHNMAGQIVDKVQETAGRLVGSDQGGQGSSDGGDGGVTGPMMDQATEQVTSRLDMGKDYVVETMTGVAQALRQTGQHLREEGAQPTLAGYAERGAEQVERFGGYLRRRDSSALLAEAEAFARRQPMVFSGAAFALGMLAVRFFRSEAPPQRQTSSMATSGSYNASSMGNSSTTPSQARPATTSTAPAGSTSMPSGGFSGSPSSPSPSTANRPSSTQPTTSTGGGMSTQTHTTPGSEDTQRLSASPASPAMPTPPPLGSTPRPAGTPSSGTGSGTQTGGTQTGETSSPSERTGSERPQR